MTYTPALAAKLSGATPYQLNKWRTKGLLVPEVSPARPPVYSYRDLVALRAMVFIRAKTSAQRLRAAWGKLDMVAVADHPSAYSFGTDGRGIFVRLPDGTVLDLIDKPGHLLSEYTFEELFEEFENFRGQRVADLRRPARSLSIHPRTLGGYPVVEGTRVPFDTIAQLVDGDDVTTEDIPDMFPRVSARAAHDAVEFARSLEEAM
ncbi:DUF433 domain-containing protein [Microbacterium testaceum]|uniref:DUF433 domain-containing protein n=1 Tax=Microbacterium testaceum TaxID=2033 RepID=UPI0025B06C4B|nr:DUF433 domain-containing protein [Microbacterium testaceum]WJS92476.1 DUF433 domain-containing protein [Microbacterium testaceum]